MMLDVKMPRLSMWNRLTFLPSFSQIGKIIYSLWIALSRSMNIHFILIELNSVFAYAEFFKHSN